MEHLYDTRFRDVFTSLCERAKENAPIDPKEFRKYEVKRGLRNSDGTGVMAGLTRVCNVHGYVLDEGEKTPVEGRLTYRGYRVEDLVEGSIRQGRFGFEEVVFLLLFGSLPTDAQLEEFRELLDSCRELPEYFAEDMIIKAPSPNLMNKMGRSVLALYSYDKNPDDTSVENAMRQSIELIAMLHSILGYSYQVKRRHYDRESMYFHPLIPGLSTSEIILRTIRADASYTREEALLLDMCLMLHAEHGGGNNSTFTTRVLSSSGTDTYSAISAAIGSLKGPRHGGANLQVIRMMEDIKAHVSDVYDEDAVADYLKKMLHKEAGDGSGLIYGMGHAVYTLSDPRAVLLRQEAQKAAARSGLQDDFALLSTIEKLTPGLMASERGIDKAVCANVDLYSGLIYRSMGISEELFTPLFAMARISGWCAHRIEELLTGGKIIRPAYKPFGKTRTYVPLEER